MEFLNTKAQSKRNNTNILRRAKVGKYKEYIFILLIFYLHSKTLEGSILAHAQGLLLTVWSGITPGRSQDV